MSVDTYVTECLDNNAEKVPSLDDTDRLLEAALKQIPWVPKNLIDIFQS